MLSELTRHIEQMLASGIGLKEIEVDDKTFGQIQFEIHQRDVRFSKPADPRFKDFMMMEIMGVSVIRSSWRNQAPADSVIITPLRRP